MIKPALAVAAAFVFGLAACAPTRHQPPGSEADLLAIQGKLSETEEKIEQLTQRVTLIQIMVDSHQRTLQDLTDGAATGDVDADIPPASPVPETNTTPVISQAAPPVSEMKKAVPVSKTAPSELPSEPQVGETAQRPETDERLMVPEPNPRYREAMEIFRGGDYKRAAGLFEAFAQQFPKDDLADNALYWSGECRYTQKDYAGALKQFRQVIEAYPSGSKVPDALLKIGFTYLSLGDKESAVTYLKKVVAQYPFSTAGAKAEERLKTLQK